MIVVFLLSTACIGVHQVLLLSPLGLGLATRFTPDLLTSEARHSSIILANAEGIISLPGYFALYLWGTALGLLVRVHFSEDNAVDSPKFKFLSIQDKVTW